MHTVADAGFSSLQTSVSTPAKVAIAGATGYTGQELLRLLSRHPSVTLPAAMSSGTSAARALPDATAAELAPALVDAGVRVIDLSGAFRLTSAAGRARWYPETHRVPDGL